MSDRRDQVLDAAIRVLGTGGLRQLTHRAVDAAADLPVGSTSNLFRTRDALLTGVLDRLMVLETAGWRETADANPPASVEEFAAMTGALALHLAGPERVLTLARHAVFQEAAFRPELRRRINAAQHELADLATGRMTSIGSTDPARHLHELMALIDGLLHQQLANPAPVFDPVPAITALLRGQLAGD